MKIKVGTYNICHCRDFSNFDENKKSEPEIVDIDQTANVVKSLDCDFIGLNEVFNEGTETQKPFFKHQTAKIAEKAGYPFNFFAKGHDHGFTDIGNGVLSKYPIKEFTTVNVPTVPKNERTENYWYESRALAVSEVDFNGKTVTIIATHFGLVPIEVERIVKKACEVIDSSKYPVIMLGDFNLTPDDERLSKIKERLKSVSAEVGNMEFTFSSYHPSRILDYIFVPKSAKILSYTVHKTRASDHYPITAEIEI